MRKKILAIVTSIMLSLSLLITPFASFAAGLTQATNAEKIEYGTLTQADKDFLNQFFDADYYAAKNPDVVGSVGNSREALFKHFCEEGIFEGRTCSAEFDPAAYASAYPELFALYGKNIMAYFRDFYSKTAAERATLIATLEACAKANITVKGLADDSIVITPELYYIAKQYNIDSLASAKAIQQALKTGQPTEVQGNGDGTVDEEDDVILVPADADNDILLRAKGFEPLGVVLVSGEPVILYIKQSWTEVSAGIWEPGAAIFRETVDHDQLLIQTENYNDEGDCERVADIWIVNDKDAYEEDGIAGGPKVFSFVDVTNGEEHVRLMPDEVESTSSTSYAMGGMEAYLDPNGTEETEYNLTATISIDEETGFSGAIGVYNEETGFAYIATLNNVGEMD